MILALSQSFNPSSQVCKGGKKKKRKGKKSVEKRLYGEREIASKKPLLSPIPELPEVSEVPFAGIRRLHAGISCSRSHLLSLLRPLCCSLILSSLVALTL